MIKGESLLSEWGVVVYEDDETGEVSFQCICGGIAMYFERVVLTPDEVTELRAGRLDTNQLVSDICKHKPNVESRLVPPLELPPPRKRTPGPP